MHHSKDAPTLQHHSSNQVVAVVRRSPRFRQESRARYVFQYFNNLGFDELLLAILPEHDGEVQYCLHNVHNHRDTEQNPGHFVCKLAYATPFCFDDCNIVFSDYENSKHVLLRTALVVLHVKLSHLVQTITSVQQRDFCTIILSRTVRYYATGQNHSQKLMPQIKIKRY